MDLNQAWQNEKKEVFLSLLFRYSMGRVLAGGIVFFLAVLPAAAQRASDVTLDISPQLFTLLYATRAAGETPEVASAPDSGEVGRAVRQAMERLGPQEVVPLEEFFRRPRYRAGDLNAYVSAALVLQPPPEFHWMLAADQLPPDVYTLKGLPGVLQEFYEEADVGALWRRVRPAYESALRRHRTEVSRSLLELRTYLRLAGQSYPGRAYVIYVEWLVPTGLTNARNYGENYFLVVHPDNPGLLDAVRHQYLHFLLDPVVAKYASRMKSWTPLLTRAQQAPRLPHPFHDDLLLLITESFIQAVELRLHLPASEELARRLEQYERSGFVFTRFFHRALERFEEAKPSIHYYFPDLISGFDVQAEFDRLSKVDFLAPAQPASEADVRAEAEREPPALAELSPEQEMRALLTRGQQQLDDGDHEAAGESFRQVLAQDPNHPRALYGLAVLASLQGDRAEAKRYFLRTLEQARDPRILGWTHIYLGRIYDLEGRRDEAVAHYRAALALQNRGERLVQAARRGLERPFGTEEE